MDETQNRINDTCMVGMLYECQVLAAALLVDQLLGGILGLRYEADFEGPAEPSQLLALKPILLSLMTVQQNLLIKFEDRVSQT